MLSAKHQDILAETRALDVELLAKLGVKSSERLGSDCVAIPFIQAGEVVNWKYRTIAGEKRFSQDKGAAKIVWNWDVIADQTLANAPLIITEGEFDAIAAIQAGFVRAVSVPDGAPSQAMGDKDGPKYSFLDSMPIALKDVAEIILATDGDDPGRALMHDLALRLGKARCKWLRYPKGCKDLNDVLVRYGERGITETIARAAWIDVPGVFRMSELPPLPHIPIYRLGMDVVDNHLGFRGGDFTTLTGIPGMGKSTWANEVACRLASKGWPTCFASFEQRPQTDHRRNLRTWFNRRRVKDQTAEQLAAADAWIDRHFSFIVPAEDDDVSLDWVLERCSAAVIRFGAKLLVIDPWNEMDHIRPPDMTLTEYTGFAIKQFRKFAKKHGVHVMVAAHPTKQKKLDDGSFSIPTLYDISDSAAWFNKSDVGIVIHRTKDGTTLRIAKSKYHDELGPPGDVMLSFNTEMGRYEVVPEAFEQENRT